MFFFYTANRIIQKIGQLPSLAAIKQSEHGRYVRALQEIDRMEFNRALGLAAYDVGIGAFVYLRRIFERLIWRHYDLARQRGAEIGDRDEFRRRPMDCKIELLKEDLPAVVVENKDVYGILSKGLHELEDEECSLHFPVVKDAILLILEQELARRDQEKLTADVRRGIATIRAHLKRGG